VFGAVEDPKRLSGTIRSFAQGITDRHARPSGKLVVSVSVKAQKYVVSQSDCRQGLGLQQIAESWAWVTGRSALVRNSAEGGEHPAQKVYRANHQNQEFRANGINLLRLSRRSPF